MCVCFFVSFAETQKRERKRRARAAQEARAAAKDVRAEKLRTNRIAAMRAFTVDLQVMCVRVCVCVYVCACVCACVCVCVLFVVVVDVAFDPQTPFVCFFV